MLELSYGKSLLRSMSSACELSVAKDELSLMQGVAIVRDTQRGVFVSIAKASGTDATFKTVCSKLEAASKKPASGNVFKNGYPFKRPSMGMRGDTKGVFSDLEILAGIVVDPTGNNKCMTRPNDGIFHWSEQTNNKIDSLTTEDTHLKLVTSMFALFLNLMLDTDDSLSQGSCFEEFMNDFNLMTKR